MKTRFARTIQRTVTPFLQPPRIPARIGKSRLLQMTCSLAFRSLAFPLVIAALALAFSGSAVMAANPIPGIDVVVKKKPTGTALRAKTDKDGKFIFANLQAGHYELSVQPPPQTQRATRMTKSKVERAERTRTLGVEVNSLSVTLGTEPLAPIEIEVTRDGGTISGQVLSADNAPQSADGRGALQAVPTTRIGGTPMSDIAVGLEAVPARVGNSPAGSTDLWLAGSYTHQGRFLPPRNSNGNGIVTYRDLAPGDYYVSAALRKSRNSIGSADGHAKLSTVQIILIESSGGEQASVIVSNALAVKLHFTVPPGKPQDVTITLTEADTVSPREGTNAGEFGASPEGATTRTAGTPISGIPVGLDGVPGGRFASAKTDDKGAVLFRSVEPGIYAAKAPISTSRSNKKHGFATTEFSDRGKAVTATADPANAEPFVVGFTIPPGTSQTATISIAGLLRSRMSANEASASGALRLVSAKPVLVATNKPIPGVDVVVKKKPGGKALIVKTDSEGTALIRGLEPGEYSATMTVHSSRGDFQQGLITFEFSSGAKSVTIPLTPIDKDMFQLPFVLPEGKPQDVTMTFTGGDGKE